MTDALLSIPTAPSFGLQMDPVEGLYHVMYRKRVTGSQMVDSVRMMLDVPEGAQRPDVIWDCSRVSAHIISPQEFETIGHLVLSRPWGHHAIMYSRADREDLISDLFRRYLAKHGESASTHLSMAGALAQLDRTALPPSFTTA